MGGEAYDLLGEAEGILQASSGASPGGIDRADLVEILKKGLELLRANRSAVDSEILDKIESLLAQARGASGAIANAASLPVGRVVELLDLAGRAIAFERMLISGTGERVENSISSLLKRPIALSVLAGLL